MVSAEEVIRDRKILKREEFLNLSRNSYLLSKISILFIISAIQSLLFVIIGNFILDIRGMILPFWAILFSVSCFGNMLGLNLSDTLRSTVTVYILIPLLIIPQMVLSGLFVRYDRIHEFIGNKAKVPLIADLMASRWAFEAMAVFQFKNNEYGKKFYSIDQIIAQSDYKSTFYVEKLKELTEEIILLSKKGVGKNEPNTTNENWESRDKKIRNNITILSNELLNEPVLHNRISEPGFSTPSTSVDQSLIKNVHEGILMIKDVYRDVANQAMERKDQMIRALNEYDNLTQIKNEYFNESLEDLVRNSGPGERVIEHRGRLVQLASPVYQTAPHPKSLLDYRTPLFAPRKQVFGIEMITFVFNLIIIWLMSFLLYITLYFRIFTRILNSLKWRWSERKNLV
jgi:hypothetical protein